MPQMRTAILEQDFHKRPDLGDAFAAICRHFGHTAKPVSQAFAMDKKQAVNALEGRAGVPSITKSLQARQKAQGDHYELWLALGEMIFGETLDQYEERRLQALIESTENARKLVDQRSARRQELRARAAA
jgi:hypothetical protein